jgi:hypothetical protein
MSTIPQTGPRQAIENGLSRPWSVGRRVAFRFFSIYFVLYSLTTQIGPSLLPIPKVEIPSLGDVRPVTTLVTWTAAHVFSVRRALVYMSGSGDKTFDWVLAFCILTVAIGGTIAWTVLDRRRLEYWRLYSWVRLFLRFCLSGQMILYGLARLFLFRCNFRH